MKYMARPPRLDINVIDIISRQLTRTATDMLIKFAPKIDEEKLYKLLIPAETYDVMHAASLLIKRRSKCGVDLYANTTLGNKQIECHYALTAWSRREQTQWLWPETMNSIELGTELGDMVVPVVEIAQRWVILRKLTIRMFGDMRPAMVMHMMPWLRTIIVGALEENWVTKEGELTKLLNQPTPRDVPGISRWLNKIFRDGDTLLTQYALVRDNKIETKDNEALIIPSLSDSFIPVELEEHYNEFKSRVH